MTPTLTRCLTLPLSGFRRDAYFSFPVRVPLTFREPRTGVPRFLPGPGLTLARCALQQRQHFDCIFSAPRAFYLCTGAFHFGTVYRMRIHRS
ncbi:hypothetical protein NDU88_009278 [Pleurodeles waltl]|uniref:Uncharacterized protein n=1 Tax=Pleurodeles waltl TaxID=8319 RepID=A0AAV7S009_PLEWA|nr:hypothetical protein NDU88_009278 [Pleurodeles waltl]